MLRPSIHRPHAARRLCGASTRNAHLSPSQPPHPSQPPVPPPNPPPQSSQHVACLAGPLYASSNSRHASSSAPRPNKSGGADANDRHYPTRSDDDEGHISHDRTSAYPFASDPSYIHRYRNPVSRYRDLATYYGDNTSAASSSSPGPVNDANDPRSLRRGGRPVPRTPPINFDPSATSFEARRARLEMERLWEGGAEDVISPAEIRRKRALRAAHGVGPSRREASLDAEVSAAAHLAATGTSAAKEAVPGTTAVCFPGSGSQYVGMGSFLSSFPSFERTWEEAETALSGFEAWRKGLGLEELYVQEWGMRPDEAQIMGGPMRKGAVRGGGDGLGGLKDVVFKGPQDELTRSSNAQPAILITSIAFLRALEEEYGIPVSASASYFLGHSSGEYAACVAAGALTFPDAVRLTRLHGLLTTRTLERSSLAPYTDLSSPPERRAQMSALLINPGRTYDEVRAVIDKLQVSWGRKEDVKKDVDGGEGGMGRRMWVAKEDEEHLVEVASYNSATQIVLSGSRAGVLDACEELHELGIANRAADLPVAAPFHCSFMRPAAEGMDLALSFVPIQDPRKPIVSGLTASPVVDAATLRRHLVGLIPRPVVWSDCIRYLRSRGVEHSIFIGPGRALANLAKREGQAGGWVKRDVQGRSGSGGGVGGAGTVKLRTRAGVKQVPAPQGAQASLEKDGQKPQTPPSDQAMMDVLSVATEADYGRLREIFFPRP